MYLHAASVPYIGLHQRVNSATVGLPDGPSLQLGNHDYRIQQDNGQDLRVRSGGESVQFLQLLPRGRIIVSCILFDSFVGYS